MTSSTKPRKYNVSQCRNNRQGTTKSRSQSTCTENLVKFGLLELFEIREQTNRDRQTNRHTYHNTSHRCWGEVQQIVCDHSEHSREMQSADLSWLSSVCQKHNINSVAIELSGTSRANERCSAVNHCIGSTIKPPPRHTIIYYTSLPFPV